MDAGLSADERGELKRQRQEAKWERRRAEHLAKLAAADSDRGDPPEAVADWRVDPDMVPEVLAVWEMAMVSLPEDACRAAGSASRDCHAVQARNSCITARYTA